MNDYSDSNLKKFFLISISAHLIALICIYLVPVEKLRGPKEILTRLVSPEEFEEPEVRLPEKTRPLPVFPPVAKRLKPALPPKTASIPRQPPAREILPPERPVVPGEGKGVEKPFPEKREPAGPSREGEDTGKKEALKSKSSEKPGYLPREKLFDRSVIDQIAKREVGDETKKDKAITFDTRELRYAGYMSQLKSKLENSGCWVYPSEAAAKGIQGDLFIRFNIKKNGRLGEVELLRTSGYKMLDDAALRALKNCEPYWPLLDEWGMEAMPVDGHFFYSIYGTFVR